SLTLSAGSTGTNPGNGTGSSAVLQDVHDGVECRFGLALTIPEQRIVHAPAVQPGVGIAQSPEGDARDGIAMFQEHAEHVGVAPRQLLLYLRRQTSRVRIGYRWL